MTDTDKLAAEVVVAVRQHLFEVGIEPGMTPAEKRAQWYRYRFAGMGREPMAIPEAPKEAALISSLRDVIERNGHDYCHVCDEIHNILTDYLGDD